MHPQVESEALVAAGWRQRDLPGFASLVGPLWTRKEGESWAYGVLTTSSHANPAGLVHGGLLTTLIDHALSAIAWEALDRRACVTIQLDTKFMSAARPGQFLEARGRVLRASKSLVFMLGSVTVAGDEILSASAVLKALASKEHPPG